MYVILLDGSDRLTTIQAHRINSVMAPAISDIRPDSPLAVISAADVQFCIALTKENWYVIVVRIT